MNITYQNVFWLFMIGNVLGVLLEGLWCLFLYKRWESHVVTLWGPFNLVYGIGMSMFFVLRILLDNYGSAIRGFVLGIMASVVEFISGIIIKVGLRMKAWDYSKHFMNIQGIISLKMTLLWIIIGFAFDYNFHHIAKIAFITTGAIWNIACVILSVFMVINIICTALCIIRWALRHKGQKPMNSIDLFIDKHYPDERMERRFCEWSFIDGTAKATFAESN